MRLVNLLLVVSSFAAWAADPADLVLRNGRIVTLDSKKPEGQAIAVRGGRIIAVGSNAEIAKYKAAQTIDLKGAPLWGFTYRVVCEVLGIEPPQQT